MRCFCNDYTVHAIYFWKFFTIKWSYFDPEGKDNKNYCLRWIGEVILNVAIKIMSTTSMIFLNAQIAWILGYLSAYKKKHTAIEEQSNGFSQIFFMEFFNMGCIMLLASFDPTGIFKQLAGSKDKTVYTGFTNDWY